MYKVIVVDRDGEKFECVEVIAYSVPAGTLILHYNDGSKSIYASGSWLEADIEPMDNPQAAPSSNNPDYQV